MINCIPEKTIVVITYPYINLRKHMWITKILEHKFLESISAIKGSTHRQLTHPPGQNGCHFPDNILKCIFMNEKLCILIQISLKCVPNGQIDNKSAYVQVMDWCQTGRTIALVELMFLLIKPNLYKVYFTLLYFRSQSITWMIAEFTKAYMWH